MCCCRVRDGRETAQNIYRCEAALRVRRYVRDMAWRVHQSSYQLGIGLLGLGVGPSPVGRGDGMPVGIPVGIAEGIGDGLAVGISVGGSVVPRSASAKIRVPGISSTESVGISTGACARMRPASPPATARIAHTKVRAIMLDSLNFGRPVYKQMNTGNSGSQQREELWVVGRFFAWIGSQKTRRYNVISILLVGLSPDNRSSKPILLVGLSPDNRSSKLINLTSSSMSQHRTDLFHVRP